MKIAPQFRAFLDSFHYLALPKIGMFESISTEVNPLTGEIDRHLVRFSSDAEVICSTEFISFISQNLKIDSRIAESDLSSFCNSIRELLSQGFEAEIPGIGFLHSDSRNQIIFSGKSIYNASLQRPTRKAASVMSSSFWL